MCAQSQRTFEGHSSNVDALALSPDGKTLYSGSDDKTIRAWSTESGAVRPGVRRLSVSVCVGVCSSSAGCVRQCLRSDVRVTPRC